jgi:hypothetical protein
MLHFECWIISFDGCGRHPAERVAGSDGTTASRDWPLVVFLVFAKDANESEIGGPR